MLKGCPWPHRRLYVHVSGYSTCCRGHMHKDSLVEDTSLSMSPSEIWNSSQFTELREKTQNGDWSWCSMCPLVPQCAVPVEFNPVGHPDTIYLSDSWSCNMSCPSCRNNVIIENANGQRSRRRRLRRLMIEYLPGLRLLHLMNSGEVFMSPMHVDLLRSLSPAKYPNLKLSILTNGTMFAREWPKMQNVHGMMDRISISVDAATSETYRKIRRGGSWDNVLEAMRMCGHMVERGTLPNFHLMYVVNAINIVEMEQFVALGKAFGATKIGFSMMVPWTNSDWSNENTLIGESGRKKINEVLRQDFMKDPIVHAPTLKHVDDIQWGES